MTYLQVQEKGIEGPWIQALAGLEETITFNPILFLTVPPPHQNRAGFWAREDIKTCLSAGPNQGYGHHTYCSTSECIKIFQIRVQLRT